MDGQYAVIDVLDFDARAVIDRWPGSLARGVGAEPPGRS